MSGDAVDAAALSAALMQLRARARHAQGTPVRASAAGLALTWLCRRAATRTVHGEELLGVEAAWGPDLPAPPDARAIVALLPAELVPASVADDRAPERVRLALVFRLQPGHFRCKDCGWGDATDARGTHPGCCAACAGERHRELMEWTAKPEPESD